MNFPLQLVVADLLFTFSVIRELVLEHDERHGGGATTRAKCKVHSIELVKFVRPELILTQQSEADRVNHLKSSYLNHAIKTEDILSFIESSSFDTLCKI